MKRKQIFVLLGALLLCVLLLSARRTAKSEELELSEDEARMEIALAYVMNSKMPMQGILMLRDMLEADPGNTEIRERLAQFSVRTGQFEKAAEHYRILAETYEGEKRAHALINYFDATVSSGERNMKDLAWCLVEMKKMQDIVDDQMLLKEMSKRLSNFENIE